jgi:hypothetical protein
MDTGITSEVRREVYDSRPVDVERGGAVRAADDGSTVPNTSMARTG